MCACTSVAIITPWVTIPTCLKLSPNVLQRVTAEDIYGTTTPDEKIKFQVPAGRDRLSPRKVNAAKVELSYQIQGRSDPAGDLNFRERLALLSRPIGNCITLIIIPLRSCAYRSSTSSLRPVRPRQKSAVSSVH